MSKYARAAYVLAVLASTAAVAAPAGAAITGGIGLRLVSAPAPDDPRARLYIVEHLAPGTTIQRRIEVSNTTASRARILLYPAAATITEGSFQGAAGHTANDVSMWTSVVPRESDVAPSGRATADVTISVPSDAAPGEQYAVVWAEARATSHGTGIIHVSRVGIRVYLSVGPGGPPAAGFTIDSLSAKRSPDGQPVVVAAVHNTGGRALDMSGTLQLSAGPGGLRAGPFPATLGVTLAIGDTEQITIALDKRLPAGPWDARIALHSGLLERIARATLTFPDTGASPAVRPMPARPPWLYPGIAGIVAALLAGIATIHGKRKRRSRQHPKIVVPAI